MRNALPMAAAAIVLAIAWLVPLEAALPGPFSAWMTTHIAVVAIAAPLLAVALAGGRFDPFRQRQSLFAPLLLSVVELAVVWGWHAPRLHAAARAVGPLEVVEQGSFLLVGTLLWLASLGGSRARRWVGVAALLFTSMHMTLLGALVALPPRPLHAYGGALSSTASLADQHAGGAIMIGVGGAAYLVGGLWLTASLLRGRPVSAPAPTGARAT